MFQPIKIARRTSLAHSKSIYDSTAFGVAPGTDYEVGAQVVRLSQQEKVDGDFLGEEDIRRFSIPLTEQTVKVSIQDRIEFAGDYYIVQDVDISEDYSVVVIASKTRSR